MVKFLSDEWIDYAKKYILEKLDPEKDMKSITTSILLIIENVPPNNETINLYIELKNGKLNDLQVSIGEIYDRKEAVFVIRGNYGTYKDILEGKLGTAMALLKNRLKLKGSRMEILKIIKPIDGLIESLRKVTDEFEK